MANGSVVNFIVAQATEKTTKSPSTPAVAVALGSLVIMALLSIFFGSYRSVSCNKERKCVAITTKDAAMFPIKASFMLFGMHIIFKLSSKDLLPDTVHCFIVVSALIHVLSPIVNKLVPGAVPNIKYHIINYKFSSHDIVALICSLGVGAWYFIQRHWVANNLFGLAIAVNTMERIHLSNVVAGCILLSGLLIYDIFWVFGTDVMVTLAANIEAPNKLVFPEDLLTHGLSAHHFTILGLGDVVVPGIFIALLLRFDHSLKRQSKLYFHATFIAYFVGLMVTIFAMLMFEHAQPALLYLVPVCLGTPLAVALVKGDLTALFKYEENGNGAQKNKRKKKSK